MIKPFLGLSVALLLSTNAFASESNDYDVVSPEDITPVLATSAHATSNATTFDLSMPADYARCQKTAELTEYLNSIPKNDAKRLTELKNFLVGCRSLLTERIENTQNEIAKLKQPK